MRPVLFLILFAIVVPGTIGEPSFRVDVQLPPSYSRIAPGDTLLFTVRLLANDEPRGDVEFISGLLAADNTVIASEAVVMPAAHGADHLHMMTMPADLPQGRYYLDVRAVRGNQTSDDRTVFEVVTRDAPSRNAVFGSLFDIAVAIPKAYTIIAPGGELLANVKLTNLGSEGRVDVFIDYDILDADHAELQHKSETVAVETQSSFVKTFNIPATAPEGAYRLRAKVTYADGKTAAGEESFTIASSAIPLSPELMLVIIAIIFVVLVLGHRIRRYIKHERLSLQVHSIVTRRLRWRR